MKIRGPRNHPGPSNFGASVRERTFPSLCESATGVVPAEAGIQKGCSGHPSCRQESWIPASAGMTDPGPHRGIWALFVILAKAAPGINQTKRTTLQGTPSPHPAAYPPSPGSPPRRRYAAGVRCRRTAPPAMHHPRGTFGRQSSPNRVS